MKKILQYLSSYYKLPINKSVKQNVDIFNNMNSQERKNTMKLHILRYLSKNDIGCLNDIKHSNIVRAFLTYILTGFQPQHDNDISTRMIGYNRVYAELLNDDYEIQQIREFSKNKYIVYGYKDTTYIVNNRYELSHIAFSTNDTNISYDNNPLLPLSEFLLIYRNNKIYVTTPDYDMSVQALEHFSFNNGFGTMSYAIPIHNINNIRNNSVFGKDWIKEYMFKPATGYIYFLKLDVNGIITYKVGITKHSVEQRFKNIPKYIMILEHKTFKRNMLECAIIERYLHNTNYDMMDTSIMEFEFEGKTECYHNDISVQYNEHILQKALMHLEATQYPIPYESILNILHKQNN